MPTKEEELFQERLNKLQRLRERGIDPYPPRYDKTHTAAQALDLYESDEAQATTLESLSVGGRVTALRVMGRAAFMDLRDGTGVIQAFVARDKVSESDYEMLRDIDLGDIVGVRGPLFKTRTGQV